MKYVIALVFLILFTFPCMAQAVTSCSTPNITLAWTLSTSETLTPNPVTGYQIWGATVAGAEVASGTPMASVAKGVVKVTFPTPLVPGLHVEPGVHQERPPVRGVPLQLVPPGRGLAQQLQHLDRARHDHRRHRVAEQVGPRPLAAHLHQLRPPAHAPARRAPHRLAQRGGDDGSSPPPRSARAFRGPSSR